MNPNHVMQRTIPAFNSRASAAIGAYCSAIVVRDVSRLWISFLL